MRIRPANTQRVHARTARVVPLWPSGQAAVYAERRALELDGRVWCFKTEGGGYLAIFQGQRSFRQRRHACSCVQMANIAFDRADPAEILGIGCSAEGIRQGGHFDRVADIGSGAVAFDIVNRVCVNACGLMGRSNRIRLPADRRCKITCFVSPVIVDRAAFQHSPDRIAIPDGVVQPAKRNDTRA